MKMLLGLILLVGSMNVFADGACVASDLSKCDQTGCTSLASAGTKVKWESAKCVVANAEVPSDVCKTNSNAKGAVKTEDDKKDETAGVAAEKK